MPCNAIHPIQDLFLEGFSYVLQIDMHFICTPMWTKFYSCKKWVLHMVYPTANKVLLSCHRSGVAIAVGDCVSGRRLVEAVARFGTSTSEVSSLTAIEAPPISRVLHWPLNGLQPRHVLTSQGSSLGGVGAFYELVLWSLVALHCSLGSLLQLCSRLLLGSTLYRSGRWHTYLGPRVVATLSLALLLPLMLHDTRVVFQHQCLVHHILEIPKVSGLQCISQTVIEPVEEIILFLLVSVHIVRGVVR
jgi:hypothetical protein